MTGPIAIIPKNAAERIQVSLEDFQGRQYIDLRTYYPDGGDWKPTKKGVAIRPDLLRSIIDALNLAEEQARKGGLL